MKRKIITFILITGMALSLTACGYKNNAGVNVVSAVDGENTDYEDSSDMDKPVTADSAYEASNNKEIIKSSTVDEAHIKAYNEAFKNSDSYDPVFEERCVYINGIRAYLPVTVKDYEQLFDVEFTSAVPSLWGAYYVTKDNMSVKVMFPGEYLEDKDFDFLNEGKSIPIVGFDPKTRPAEKENLWSEYQVAFEDVPKEKINDYGYYYTGSDFYEYYPACYQAFYLYLNGMMPEECIEGNLYFIDSIVDYAGGEDYVQVGFGDATCDALDEMFIKTKSDYYENGYNDVRVFTYDSIDKKFREIYYSWLDVEDQYRNYDIGVSNGMLEEQDWAGNQNSRNITYTAYNRYGRGWNYCTTEYWFDDEMYEPHYIVNKEEVDKETYDKASFFVGGKGAVVYYPLKDIWPQLDTKGTLTAAGIMNNGLSYEQLKSAINELDLKSIGYNNNESPDNEIDADYENYNYDNPADDNDGKGIPFVITAATDGGVNMRSGPGTEYDIVIEMIPNGESLPVFENANSSNGKLWYRVDYYGTEGWVAASQVED